MEIVILLERVQHTDQWLERHFNNLDDKIIVQGQTLTLHDIYGG